MMVHKIQSMPMKTAMEHPKNDPGSITMMIMIFLGLLILIGVFIVGPIMSILQ